MFLGMRQSRLWASAFMAHGLLFAAFVAHASEFSVGRVEVKFAEPGWEEVTLPDTTQAYGGEKRGELSVQTRMYALGTTSEADRVLVLVSSVSHGIDGSQASMRYSPNCKTEGRSYREGNSGAQMPFAQCLTVLPQYTSESVFQALAPQVLELQRAGKVSLMGPVYTISSFHAISTGTYLHVQVFTTALLRVPEVNVTDTLPGGVQPELVVWGRQLKDAVKRSVHSLSGRLLFPAIQPVPPKPQALGTVVGNG